MSRRSESSGWGRRVSSRRSTIDAHSVRDSRRRVELDRAHVFRVFGTAPMVQGQPEQMLHTRVAAKGMGLYCHC
jgi:hypothetical protein